MTDRTDIDAALEAAKEPFVVGPQDSRMAVPEGWSIINQEHMLPRPVRLVQETIVTEAASFSAYLKRFARPETVVFANKEEAEVQAIIDYHGPDGQPSHCSHTVAYAMAASPEWKKWRLKNGSEMSQDKFGLFLEDVAHTIIAPDAASVMEAAMNLEAVKKVNFKSAVRLRDGTRQYKYEEEIQGAAGAIQLPENISAVMPIFDTEGAQQHAFDAKVRYRISSDGCLYLSYHIQHIEELEREAFTEAVEAIATALDPEIPIYYS